jgi:hypothetical protein
MFSEILFKCMSTLCVISLGRRFYYRQYMEGYFRSPDGTAALPVILKSIILNFICP